LIQREYRQGKNQGKDFWRIDGYIKAEEKKEEEEKEEIKQDK